MKQAIQQPGQLHHRVDATARENYRRTLSGLVKLMVPDEDEGELRPSAYALEQAIEYINDAVTALPERFPHAISSVTEDGGLQIYWNDRKADRKVHLLIPPSQASDIRVYHAVGQNYSVEHNAASSLLAFWLAWFMAK